jgi:hypothetical protein
VALKGHFITKARNDENRFFDIGMIEQECQIVDHTHIIDLKFRFGALLAKNPAEFPQGFKRIGEYTILAQAQKLGFPWVFVPPIYFHSTMILK